jgi:hypothetical protein
MLLFLIIVKNVLFKCCGDINMSGKDLLNSSSSSELVIGSKGDLDDLLRLGIAIEELSQLKGTISTELDKLHTAADNISVLLKKYNNCISNIECYVEDSTIVPRFSYLNVSVGNIDMELHEGDVFGAEVYDIIDY